MRRWTKMLSTAKRLGIAMRFPRRSPMSLPGAIFMSGAMASMAFVSVVLADVFPLATAARIAIQATGRVRFHVTGSAPTWIVGRSAVEPPPAVWGTVGFGLVKL